MRRHLPEQPRRHLYLIFPGDSPFELGIRQPDPRNEYNLRSTAHRTDLKKTTID